MAANKNAPERIRLDPADRLRWPAAMMPERAAKPAKPPKRPRPPRRWLRRLGYTAAVLAVWSLIAVALALAYYGYDLPDVDRLTKLNRRPNISLVATDGSTLANFGDLYGE